MTHDEGDEVRQRYIEAISPGTGALSEGLSPAR